METYNDLIFGLSTDNKPIKDDQHIFIETDSKNMYRSLNHEWLLLEPLTHKEAMLFSLLRQKSGSGVSDSDGAIFVTFTTPFSDANYAISLSQMYKFGLANVVYGDKATTGFTIFVRHPNGTGFEEVTIDWTAGPYSNL